MKVALLTAQSRVSPVFETTCNWLVINANKNGCSISATYDFNQQSEVEMVNELLAKDIQLLVCGAIPYYLEKLLIDQGCEVLSFIAGDIEEVIQALGCDLLDSPKFKMPGCKKRKRQGKKNFCNRNINDPIDTQ
jgi:predicted Fe-Mo cluster-binding NifX family protein